MKDTIRSIIKTEIPEGAIFDAHSIIEYIIHYHSDIYLSSRKNGWDTKYYHSYISKTIADFEGDMVKKAGKIWSLNIHKEFSPNECWKKQTRNT
jgi:hypothetical protein